METLKSKVYEVGQKGCQYNGICFDGKDYWLSPFYGESVVKWNPDIGVIRTFTNLAGGNSNKMLWCFLPIIFCEGFVWLFPYSSKQTIKIDVKTNEVVKAEEFKSHFAQDMDSTIYVSNKDGTLIEYNCKTQEKHEKIIKYSKSVMEKIKPFQQKFFLYNDKAKCQNITDCYYYELSLFTIFDYINCETRDCDSTKKQLFSVMNCNADGTAGKEIFNTVKTSYTTQANNFFLR